jgi:hypothetical protein
MKSDPVSIINLEEADELTIHSLVEECGTVILERDGKPQYVVLKWEGGELSNPEEIIQAAKRKLKRNMRVLQNLTKQKTKKVKGRNSLLP